MADPRVKARFEVSGQNGIVDEFKKTEKAAKDSADNIQQRYASLKSGLAALGIGTAIGLGIRAVVTNTIEQERVTKQLEQTLKATGGAAGLTKQQLLEMASALQAVTTYGDEAVIGAQNLLLTFKNIGSDVFPRALESVLDMSTVMGTDLKGASIQLGKALNDPIKGVAALAEVGVQFTDQQRDQIKTMVEAGRVADAQAVILAELEGQMGGTARAARDTLGGAIQALKNSFGDLLEGDTGSEGVRGTKKALEELTETLQSQQTKEAFATIIGLIASVTTELVSGASAWVSYFDKVAQIQGMASKLGEPSKYTDRELQIRQKMVDDQIRLARSGGGGDLEKLLAEREALVRESTRRIKTELAASTSTVDSAQPRAIAEANAELNRILEGQARLLAGPLLESAQRYRDEMQRLQEVEDKLLENKSLTEDAQARLNAAREEAARIYQREVQQSSGAKDGGRKAEAAERKAAREEELRIRAIAIANAELGRVLDEQAAVMGGPMVEAAQRYRDELVMLDEIEKTLLETRALTAESQAQLNIAREDAAKLYQDEVKAIKSQLTPNEELLEAMRFELELLGLNNDERRRAILLRHLDATATKEQIDELLALDAARVAAEKSTAAKDEFRDMFASALADAFKTGDVKSAIEGLGDAIHNAVSNRLADSITDWLFGQQGSSGGGVFDSIASWFGTLFGGGRAIGGPVEPGRFYEVGENNRPELLHTAGRTWLIPGNRGAVEPMGGAGIGGDTYNMSISFPMQGRMDRRSALQAAAAVGQQVRLAGRNA